METINDFLIGSNGQIVSSVLPIKPRTREQGLRAAAYLALLSETLPPEDPDNRPDFDTVYKAVANT